MIVGTTFAVAGCGAADVRHGLADAAPSLDTLVRTVLDALHDEDDDRLRRLLVTADEHRTLLWPELPESDDVPFAFARSMNEANSRKGLTRALERYGGQRFEVISIQFTRSPEVYRSFTLHRGARVTVRRASDGRVGELPILDVVLERGGRWKLMNYEE